MGGVRPGEGVWCPGDEGAGGQAIFEMSKRQSARRVSPYEEIENVGGVDNRGMDANHGGMARG